MTYEYQNPEKRGLTRVNLSTKDHNDLFRKSKTWWNRFEYYIDDDHFVMEEYYSIANIIIQVVLFPVVVVGEGIFNFREIIRDYKRLFRQKHYGAFISDTVSAHSQPLYDEIKNKLS